MKLADITVGAEYAIGRSTPDAFTHDAIRARVISTTTHKVSRNYRMDQQRQGVTFEKLDDETGELSIHSYYYKMHVDENGHQNFGHGYDSGRENLPQEISTVQVAPARDVLTLWADHVAVRDRLRDLKAQGEQAYDEFIRQGEILTARAETILTEEEMPSPSSSGRLEFTVDAFKALLDRIEALEAR